MVFLRITWKNLVLLHITLKNLVVVTNVTLAGDLVGKHPWYTWVTGFQADNFDL
ncbi:hypothetical protein BVC80_9091g101 [Macleaya cordata]|uniref:Uncharacterized protein n=1 Tax=Macleaya cordata TaxID=56857 RepID=A0A200PWL6_MACCD|nr:hypothetical protein BVC80_9091g101 [Macleaya cordata]